MVSSSYAGRNVLNASELKQAITARSLQRNDSDEVKSWLMNHFFRYAVGNFESTEPQLVQIKSVHQAAFLTKGMLPSWLNSHLKNTHSAPIWWLDSNGAALLQLEEQLVEFLSARKGTALEGKLSRINCFQAFELWQKEHALFESKALVFWREHQPSAVQEVWQDQRGAFVELLPHSPQLRAEMAYESQMMRHCLGQFSNKKQLKGGYGEHYAEACEQGNIRLFSYRSGETRHPHITLSAAIGENGLLRIEQIKGKQNKPPIARYADIVINFLNFLPTCQQYCDDAANMGIVCLAGTWKKVQDINTEAEQLSLVMEHPALAVEIAEPSVLTQWLMLAVQPNALDSEKLSTTVKSALLGS